MDSWNSLCWQEEKNWWILWTVNGIIFENLIKTKKMGSKFFGNRMDKQAPNKKGVKQNFKNKSNNAKSGGVRKTGRGN